MSSSNSEDSPDNAFTASKVFPGGTLIECVANFESPVFVGVSSMSLH